MAIVAASVKQTLHMAMPGSDLGRLLFDSNLPLHAFIVSLRAFLKHDLEDGIERGEFHVSNEIAVITMVSGSVYGSMQDIYRGALPVEMISDITEMVLLLLGADPVAAAQQARCAIEFRPLLQLPLAATDLLPPLGAAAK